MEIFPACLHPDSTRYRYTPFTQVQPFLCVFTLGAEECYLLSADSVSVGGKSVPYVPLATSYADYTSDCWTYDGR